MSLSDYIGFAPVYSSRGARVNGRDSESVPSWTPACLKNVFMGIVSARKDEAVAAPRAAPGPSQWSSFASFGVELAAVIGLASFGEYLFSWDVGIDQLLFADNPHAIGIIGPVRRVPAVARTRRSSRARESAWPLLNVSRTDAEMCMRALKPNGVKDGAEALDLVFRRGNCAGRNNGVKPEVVLLNLRLPKADGIRIP